METTPDILSPLKPLQLPFRILIVLIFAAVASSFILGTFYRTLSQMFSPIWIGVAVFHTILSLVIVVAMIRRRELRARFSVVPDTGMIGSVRPLAFYLPSLVVLAAALTAAVLSTVTGGQIRIEPDWISQLAFVLWIPIVEEIVFRGAISGITEKYAPGVWGLWFSALIFAWVHSMPTIYGPVTGVPLGPFLLGLICEYLRRAGGTLVPAVIFHMVCNSTVVIFSLLDARWMNWLQLLYG